MGNQLFEEVVKLSGLPPKLIKKELRIILKKAGVKPKRMTKISLRKAMANYLKDVVSQFIQEDSIKEQ